MATATSLNLAALAKPETREVYAFVWADAEFNHLLRTLADYAANPGA